MAGSTHSSDGQQREGDVVNLIILLCLADQVLIRPETHEATHVQPADPAHTLWLTVMHGILLRQKPATAGQLPCVLMLSPAADLAYPQVSGWAPLVSRL